MPKKSIKMQIELPKELADSLMTLSGYLGLKRNQVIAEALQDYSDRMTPNAQEYEKKLNEYKEMLHRELFGVEAPVKDVDVIEEDEDDFEEDDLDVENFMKELRLK
jgi:hypothetical protein